MRHRVPEPSRPHRLGGPASSLVGWVTAVVVVAATILAAPAGAATLTAPVIREIFTVLPCSGAPANRATLQLEGCGEHRVLDSDAQINALNAEIFAKLQTTTARRDFIAGHNAWVSYRRRYCLAESDIYQGGTLAPVLFIECVQAVNSDHVKELQEFLANLEH